MNLIIIIWIVVLVIIIIVLIALCFALNDEVWNLERHGVSVDNIHDREIRKLKKGHMDELNTRYNKRLEKIKELWADHEREVQKYKKEIADLNERIKKLKPKVKQEAIIAMDKGIKKFRDEVPSKAPKTKKVRVTKATAKKLTATKKIVKKPVKKKKVSPKKK